MRVFSEDARVCDTANTVYVYKIGKPNTCTNQCTVYMWCVKIKVIAMRAESYRHDFSVPVNIYTVDKLYIKIFKQLNAGYSYMYHSCLCRKDILLWRGTRTLGAYARSEGIKRIGDHHMFANAKEKRSKDATASENLDRKQWG